MWQKHLPLARARELAQTFSPPYCPNPKCFLHLPERVGAPFYTRRGKRKISRYPHFSTRFRCKLCKHTFTSSVFQLEYRDRKNISYARIFDLSRNNVTKCEMARLLGCSEFTIRQRLIKLSRWGLLIHAKLTEKLKIKEPIVYDGLENFSFSQFDPNNINHAVGKDTLFVYDFNFAPMNRKGRMSPRQQAKSRLLENKFGIYKPNAIQAATKRILLRLKHKTKELHFISDNHFAYRRAIKEVFKVGEIDHTIVPSKIYRNYRNKLFAINHLDMLTRHNLAPFKRETIAFSKHSIAMRESFALYVVFKNYMRPQFYRPHKDYPEAHRRSPAMQVGISKRIFSFNEFFRTRVMKTQVKLNKDWQQIIERRDSSSRRPIATYAGI